MSTDREFDQRPLGCELDRLEERLEPFLGRLPPGLEDGFRSYRAARQNRLDDEHALAVPGLGDVYWLRLPEWHLSKRSHGAVVGHPASLLADVLWAQYCVFLAVRTRDDLLDGQTALGGLEQVAEHLLLESESALKRHFSIQSSTLRFLAASVRTTQRAIRQVDRAQRRPGGMSRHALPLYARVARVFQLGSVAICEWAGSTSDLLPTARFCAHLAMAGQIVDDLEDMLEDLAQGRVNYAAARLIESESARGNRGDDPEMLIAQALLGGAAPAALLDHVRARLRHAGRAIQSSGLPPAERFIADRLLEVDQLATSLHRRLVACTLSDRRPCAG